MAEIRLLGSPSVTGGAGNARGPKGRKGWAVVALVVLSSRPLSRRELVGMLFADAEDPLGALRWTLSEMRRTFGCRELLRGDPIALGGTRTPNVDVLTLTAGGPGAVAVAERAGELLAGFDFPGCPEFEAWLAAEQRHVQAQVEAVLRDASMQHLAGGDTAAAVRLAARAVACNPLDEALQELLIRCLARNGERAAALAQADRCEALFKEQLGARPSPALRAAADDAPRLADLEEIPPAALAALAAIGKAAVDAGAIDAGIQTLRRVAAASSEPSRRALSLMLLGSVLVHGLRGHDEEGAVLLHEAARLARDSGDLPTAVSALRELAYVDVQAGRVAGVESRLAEAMALAGDDDSLRCGALGITGLFRSDRGDQPGAIAALDESVAAAESCGDVRQAAWSKALRGRASLLAAELGDARSALDDAIAACRATRWHAFLPFPLAMRAELALQADETGDRAEMLLQESFTLGCELGDPCWEALAECGLALLSLRRGNLDDAWSSATDARRRCVRHPDRYVWVEAWVLLRLVTVARRCGRDGEAERTAAHLLELCQRTEQPHMASRLAAAR